MGGIINTRILSNPLNWVIVLTMVMFSGVAVDLIRQGLSAFQPRPVN